MKKHHREIFELLRDYNTQYGEIKIYDCGMYIYIIIANGGWSYNEELESKLNAAHLYKMLDLHPVKIFKLLNHKHQYERLLKYFNNFVEKKSVNFIWKLGEYTNK